MASKVVGTFVFVNTRFRALHRWKDAPDEVKFLRDYHRHEFHVRLTKLVEHDDRAIEFITLKRGVDLFLVNNWEGKELDLSCEQFAGRLLLAFDATTVEVSEDGENGAVVFGVDEDE